MERLKGLATGIGSLPFLDAAQALDLIFKYCPQVPFWPQLPKRHANEGMVTQFTEKLPAMQKGLEDFYEKLIACDINYFRISRDYAEGLYAFKERLEKQAALLKEIRFIKCQITGPFTFAASINDESGASLLRDKVFMQAFSKGLAMKALWQVEFFKEFGKKIIIFIDEPYLGCFGSAYTPVNREEVVKVLSELSAGLKSENVLIGIHCCGNTDWSIFTDIADIDIISFDAFSFAQRLVLYADNLKSFFKKGGLLCWGIIPTQEPSARETAASLAGKIKQSVNALVEKGLDRDLVSAGLLVSPACGLGMLGTDKPEKIFKLLSETSSFIRKSF